MFVGTFTCGRARAWRSATARLRILQEGRNRKFVPAVEQVTFSGERAREMGHETLYVTERAVFRLTETGLRLEEIAPGVDLEHEVLGQMDFTPEIKRPLGTMDPRLFRTEPMGLRRMLEDRPLASRFEFDPQREVLFINFAGLAIRDEEDLRRHRGRPSTRSALRWDGGSGRSSTTTASASPRTWPMRTPSWSGSSPSATTSG